MKYWDENIKGKMDLLKDELVFEIRSEEGVGVKGVDKRKSVLGRGNNMCKDTMARGNMALRKD